MRHTLLITLLLLSATQACFAEDPPGVAAAREAALQHNDAIAEADSNLEAAIAAAHRSHDRQVIAAKERMINSLRRAYRSALRSSQPENAGTIERQIAVLQEQIDRLESQVNAPLAAEDPEPEDILEGLDPRLVGVVYLHGTKRNGDPHGRAYAISPEGLLRVILDLDGAGDGIDIGSLYRGEVVGDEFVVHFADWTVKDFENGRVQAISVNNRGQLVARHGRFEDFQRGVTLTVTCDYEESYFETVDAFRAFVRGDEQEPADVPERVVVEEPEEEPVEEPSGDDPGLDFFGVPIE